MKGTLSYYPTNPQFTLHENMPRMAKKNSSKPGHYKKYMAKVGTKRKRGRAQSHTKTKRRKSEIVKNVGNHTVVRTYNKVCYKLSALSKRYKGLGQTSLYERTTTFGTLSGEGVQSVNTLTGLCERADIISAYNTAAQFYNAATVAAVDQQFDTTGHESGRFMLKTVIYEVKIVNQAPSTADFDLYICQSKNSVAAGIDPGVSWSSGLGDQSGAISGVGTLQTVPYSCPTASKQFNMEWRIIKKMKVTLESGREYSHMYHFKPNAVMDTQYWNTFSQVKGMTHRILLVQRGVLGDASNATTAAIGNISLCPTKLIGSVRRAYHVQLCAPYNRITNQSTNFTTGDSNLYVQNEELGQVINTITNVAVLGTVSNIA